MPFAIAPVNRTPCSLIDIIMVDKKIAGNTENIPLRMVPTLERVTAIAMTVPAMMLRPKSFSGV